MEGCVDQFWITQLALKVVAEIQAVPVCWSYCQPMLLYTKRVALWDSPGLHSGRSGLKLCLSQDTWRLALAGVPVVTMALGMFHGDFQVL